MGVSSGMGMDSDDVGVDAGVGVAGSFGGQSGVTWRFLQLLLL